MVKRVDIYGAGLAGCTSAIHLARAGLEVHLHDKERHAGGNPAWTPSVHTTVLDAIATWRFLGIGLSGSFQPVNSVTFYRYGRINRKQIPNFYVVERGPRFSSLDMQLFNLAMDAGVVFHTREALETAAFVDSGTSILACGLDQSAYSCLSLPAVPIYGYRAVMSSNRDQELLTYILPCTNNDFAYLAGVNGLLFGLLFSRRCLAESNLQEFIRVVDRTEGLRLPRWRASFGMVAALPNLFWRGHILAGSLSGCIDPFLLHGVSGALVSGRIAALAVLDPPTAEKVFRRVTRNHKLKRMLKMIANLTPLKVLSMPLFMLLDSYLAGVGFVYQKDEGYLFDPAGI